MTDRDLEARIEKLENEVKALREQLLDANKIRRIIRLIIAQLNVAEKAPPLPLPIAVKRKKPWSSII